jgi:hypothetical protein
LKGGETNDDKRGERGENTSASMFYRCLTNSAALADKLVARKRRKRGKRERLGTPCCRRNEGLAHCGLATKSRGPFSSAGRPGTGGCNVAAAAGSRSGAVRRLRSAARWRRGGGAATARRPGGHPGGTRQGSRKLDCRGVEEQSSY